MFSLYSCSFVFIDVRLRTKLFVYIIVESNIFSRTIFPNVFYCLLQLRDKQFVCHSMSGKREEEISHSSGTKETREKKRISSLFNIFTMKALNKLEICPNCKHSKFLSFYSYFNSMFCHCKLMLENLILIKSFLLSRRQGRLEIYKRWIFYKLIIYILDKLIIYLVKYLFNKHGVPLTRTFQK